MREILTFHDGNYDGRRGEYELSLRYMAYVVKTRGEAGITAAGRGGGGGAELAAPAANNMAACSQMLGDTSGAKLGWAIWPLLESFLPLLTH